jgi:hypothetical protein
MTNNHLQVAQLMQLVAIPPLKVFVLAVPSAHTTAVLHTSSHDRARQLSDVTRREDALTTGLPVRWHCTDCCSGGYFRMLPVHP